jgi:hypothetical protein
MIKHRTLRIKKDPYWISVYLTYWGKHTWNLGAAICKSRRAANDWNRGRYKRRRVKKFMSSLNPSTFAHMYALKRLVQTAIEVVPHGDGVVICPEQLDRTCLAKFAERFGFTYHQSDDVSLWVLITHPEAVK